MLAVEVTVEDIRDGRPKHCGSCPIALAFSRILGDGYQYVTVGLTRAEAYEIGKSWRFWTHDGRAFVVAFDKGEPVEPLTVEMKPCC